MRATHQAGHRCAHNADHLAHDTPLSAFFAEVVCTLGTTPLKPRPDRHKTGGELHYMRVRHADDTPPDGFM